MYKGASVQRPKLQADTGWAGEHGYCWKVCIKAHKSGFWAFLTLILGWQDALWDPGKNLADKHSESKVKLAA